MSYTKIVLILGVVFLVGAGCVVAPQQTADIDTNAAAGTQLEGTPAVNDTPDADLNLDSNSEEDIPTEPMQLEGETDAAADMQAQNFPEQESGNFEPYSEDKLTRANDGTVVLAFLADWCPSCRALKQSITSQLDEIPAGLTILELDYDEATELKQKYGVRTQHTMVEVDAEGNMVQSWSGGNRLSDIVDRVQ